MTEAEIFANIVEYAATNCHTHGEVHPKVAAYVFAPDGRTIATGSRQCEQQRNLHAEYVATERSARGRDLTGATVYTTWEPCTTVRHPRGTCAQRLADRGVARVVVGVLDPDPEIAGKGVQLLRDRGVQVDFFPPEWAERIRAMNAHYRP